LYDEAWRNAKALDSRDERVRWHAEPAYGRAENLRETMVDRFGTWLLSLPAERGYYEIERAFWQATHDQTGALYFHPPDVPIRVWAVFDPARRGDLGRDRDRQDHRAQRHGPLCG
jgi:hypothetical protein